MQYGSIFIEISEEGIMNTLQQIVVEESNQYNFLTKEDKGTDTTFKKKNGLVLWIIFALICGLQFVFYNALAANAETLLNVSTDGLIKPSTTSNASNIKTDPKVSAEGANKASAVETLPQDSEKTEIINSNLIKNSGDNGSLDGWGANSGITLAVSTKETGILVSGTQADNWHYGAIKLSDSKIEPGARYMLEAWINVESVSDKNFPPYLTLSILNVDGTYKNYDTSKSQLFKIGTWQKIWSVFTVDSNAGKGDVLLEKGTKSSLSIKLTLKSVSLTKLEKYPYDNITTVNTENVLRVIPTFNCLSIYWTPSEQSANTASLYYKEKDEAEWRKALDPWFDKRNMEFRGSIVNLNSNTEYKIKLISNTGVEKETQAKTWNENFQVSKTIELTNDQNEPLNITESGFPEGYVLYTSPPGKQITVDVNGIYEHSAIIGASYVILRNIILKGAKTHAIKLWACNDVVIENCDISDWGTIEDVKTGWGENMNSGIFSQSDDLYRIIIQNNQIHHPRSDSNNWDEYFEKYKSSHPRGPQGISFIDSKGNHVIRYNKIYSDDSHYFNDAIGGGENFSKKGFPNSDSDIYGNSIANCWDDGIESEGANRNVRIWDNKIDKTFVKIACAPTAIGPLYIWRNISGYAQKSSKWGSGGFLKTTADQGGGIIYVFHNTILQPPLGQDKTGCNVGLGHGPSILNIMSRNNILYSDSAIVDRKPTESLGDYDFDFCSGQIPLLHNIEQNGIKGVPEFQSIDDNLNYKLSPGSMALDKGVYIPNFNDGYKGNAPDIGALELH